MKIRYITAALLGVAILNAPLQLTADAVDNSVYEQYERAIGLIEKCSLRCTSPERGVLEITAKTQVAGKLDEVGFRNMVVQRSSDGENWSDELMLGDQIRRNVRNLSIDRQKVEVKGGGYYRLSVVHYASDTDRYSSSPKTQAAINTSSPVWIEAKPVVTTTQPTTKSTTTTTTTTRLTTTSVTTRRTTALTSAETVTSTTSKVSADRNGINNTVSSSVTKSGSTTAPQQTFARTTATSAVTSAQNSNSPKTGDRGAVMEFTALCSAGAVALFLYGNRKKRS